MRRPRWPDVVLALGVAGLLGFGVWALWGDDLKSWFSPAKEAPAVAEPSGGTT
jgi:hypothetical protein